MRSWVAQGPGGLAPLRAALEAKMNSTWFNHPDTTLADKRESIESMIRQYNQAALGMLMEIQQ